jgi:hypothetical protein
MAGAKFTKRNLNRFRKVYPFIRRTPYNELYSSSPSAIIEIAEITVTSAATAGYTFRENFPGIPVVTVTAKDTSGSPTIVATTITEVTATSITIGISATFTGTIELQAIYIPS